MNPDHYVKSSNYQEITLEDLTFCKLCKAELDIGQKVIEVNSPEPDFYICISCWVKWKGLLVNENWEGYHES